MISYFKLFRALFGDSDLTIIIACALLVIIIPTIVVLLPFDSIILLGIGLLIVDMWGKLVL